MRHIAKVSGFSAIVATTLLAASPLMAATGGAMTMGDLAVQLAQAAGIKLPANAAPAAAREALDKAGIVLGSNLQAPVSQSVLVKLGLALGVAVSTSHPEAPASQAAVGAFLQSVKGQLESAAAASGQGGADAMNASCQGRESRDDRKGEPASPSDPNATAGPC
jgi:hypothetical protein